ncbi:MAG: beta-glucosidase [Chlorobi bacterium]|nr:beta-glucosidase [Chlorobiota bacterium]
MTKLFFPVTLMVLIIILSYCTSDKNSSAPDHKTLSDTELLALVQQKTFQYFWDGAEPHSGAARERIHEDGIYPENDRNIVTTGGTGFGIMAIIAGIEEGFITRTEGYARIQKIVNFLSTADRFHGMWPHWLDGETGKVKPFSEKDDGADGVESAYLFQGLLTARQYFREGTGEENALAAKIDTLWRQAEWSWFRKNGENVLYWHWSPNYQWEMNFPVQGYNECLIYYILAASSPVWSIPPEVYHEGWARNGNIDTLVTTYGYSLSLKHNNAETYGGPLFWAHYSYLGLNPKGLQDQYADYWQENANQTRINRKWCIDNPEHYKGYGPDCWGLTASYSRNDDGSVGYAAHQPGDDKGVISPTAAISSIPYIPEYSIQAIRGFYDKYGDRLLGKYGFFDAFSPQYDWFPKRYLAIDQGPIVVMIENYRSGLLWKLFMSAPEIQEGLTKLDFSYRVEP